jgi:hypothetical protein
MFVHHCTNTKNELNPWWLVDLQAEYRIAEIRIWNRGDCFGDRLTPLHIDVFSSTNQYWSNCKNLTVPSVAWMVYNVSCEGDVIGSVVRLTLWEYQYLTVCEVEVWASMNGKRVN